MDFNMALLKFSVLGICYLLVFNASCSISKSRQSGALEGEFSCRADVALFYICKERKRYPVKGSDAYLAMERAYLSLAGMEPGQPVFARLDGHFEEGPNAEGTATTRYLVVDRFYELQKNRSCQ